MFGIGLCGIHRTGKTTLAKAYAERAGIEYVGSVVSEVFKSLGLDPKKDYPFSTRMIVQREILARSEELYNKHVGNYFITDRTPIDFLAYTMCEVMKENLAETDTLSFMDYMEKCFAVSNLYFGSIVVVQPGIPYVPDPSKGADNPAYIEHLQAVLTGNIVDRRLTTKKHFINRDIIRLEERVGVLDEVIRSVILYHMQQGDGLPLH